MKKASTIFVIVILSVIVFCFTFSSNKTIQPNTYYKVYLDDKLMGIIKSREELENYIDNQGKKIVNLVNDYSTKVDIIDNSKSILDSFNNDNTTNLTLEQKANYIINNQKSLEVSDIKVNYLKEYVNKKLYNIDQEKLKDMKDYIENNESYKNIKNIYAPNGIEIQKVKTYDDELISVEELYNNIIKEKSPTVKGYQFTIKKENSKSVIIYVTDPAIFLEAVDNMATIFIGEEAYKNYKNNTQNEIVTTGSTIKNVYVQEDITYKPINISVEEKIYTDSMELSKYLLYGNTYEQKNISIKSGDSISRVALENQISIAEFLLSNPEYTSSDNLLYEGKQVVISKINPQINIVVEKYSVSDVETNYGTVEQYDSNLNQGREVITQEGEKGLERVSQNVKFVNGQIAYIEPIGKETIKPSVSRIITVGTKQIASIGSTASWLWPINSYSISSYFQYRFSPINGKRELHTGLDIAAKYGTPIYAANNGTIESVSRAGSYGYHIIINHGNGYWTLYAHMSRFAVGMKEGTVVARGDVIGYVGATGAATGPHLHYEIRKGCGKYGCYVDPLPYYR